MITTTLYWLLAALLLLFFELASPSHFLFFSFSCGALGGAIASWLNLTIFWQALIACAFTISSFIYLRWWLQVHTKKKAEYESNMFALVGKTGIITKAAQAQEFGQVKIGGQIWSCRGVHDQAMQEGSRVRIVRVQGAHVVVEPLV
ncbi:MAG: NfeD family protein [Candidatus Babeliales bacterium]